MITITFEMKVTKDDVTRAKKTFTKSFFDWQDASEFLVGYLKKLDYKNYSNFVVVNSAVFLLQKYGAFMKSAAIVANTPQGNFFKLQPIAFSDGVGYNMPMYIADKAEKFYSAYKK